MDLHLHSLDIEPGNAQLQPNVSSSAHKGATAGGGNFVTGVPAFDVSEGIAPRDCGVPIPLALGLF